MLSSRRGFIVAPVLYAIGLIGVLGGLFASNVMPSIKLTMQAQNSISDRNAIINAASYLSAASVIGSDGLTFCPPRGAAASSICGSAPVAITNLASVSASDAHLPKGYAATASAGSPYEVGIFVAGGNLPQTDSQGHYWIVCRWENPESSPSSPAFAIIGAGANGVIQTKCGDTTSTGDDLLQLVTVGVAAQHATAWNNKSNGSTTFGAAGSQASVDSNGNITATSLTTTGGISGGAGSLSSLEVSGLSSLNGGANVGGAFIAEGTANLGITSVASLTASGNIVSGSGNLIIGGTTSLQSAYITNIQDSGALTVGGAAFMNTINATGNASFNALSTVSDATINGNFTVVGMINVSGQSLLNGGVIVTNGLSTDTLTAGTSTLGNVSTTSLIDTGAASISGPLSSASLTTTGSATIGGVLNGSSAVFTGNVQATSFSGGGVSLSSGGINATGSSSFGALTVSSLTDIGAASTGNLTVNGTIRLLGSSTGVTTFASANAGTANYTLTFPAITDTITTSTNTAIFSNKTWNGSTIGLAYGGTGATTAATALSNMLGNPAAGTYSISCTSATSCTKTTASGGGAVNSGTKYQLGYYAATGTAISGDANITTDASGDLNIEGGLILNSGDYFIQRWQTNIMFYADGSNTIIGGGWQAIPATLASSSENTYVGSSPWEITAMGNYNSALGINALSWVTTGADNTAVGVYSGQYIETGSYNSIFGNNVASNTLESGSGNILIGTSAAVDTPTSSTSNFLDIGNVIFATGITGTLATPAGFVGIGTATPHATLDVNGFARLAAQTTAPATCSSTNKGALAYASAAKRLCLCNGSSWVFDYNNSACTW